jgi:hypothetical protein
MKRMQARYPGTCASTGRPIKPGDSILYDPKNKSAHIDDDQSEAADMLSARILDSTLDNAEASAAGRYMRQAMARWQSDIWRDSSGREYYRNKRGLCIDAPCCGCCNA